MNRKLFAFILFLTCLFLAFQNCGKFEPSGSQKTSLSNNEDAGSNNGPPLSVPGIEITSRPSLFSNQTNESIVFTVSDFGGSAVSAIDCSLEAGPFEPCTSPLQITNLAEGAHQVQIRVSNNGGLQSSIDVNWSTDLTGSNINILNGPNRLTGANSAEFVFAVDDDLSGLERTQCSLNGAAPEDCSSPVALADLAVQGHTFEVTATDVAGNTQSTVFAWEVAAVAEGDAGAGQKLEAPHSLIILPGETHAIVADSGLPGLMKIDLATGDRWSLSDNNGNGVGPAYAPRDIELNSAGDTIFAVGGTLNAAGDIVGQVYRVDPVTGNRAVVSGNGVGAGPEMRTPVGIGLFNNDTEAIVVDIALDTVVRINLANGNRTVIYTFPQQFTVDRPTGVTVNAAGTLAYVMTDRAQLFSIDVNNGAATLIADGPEKNQQPNWNDIVLNAAETVAYIADNSHRILWRVDMANGNVTIANDLVIGSGPFMLYARSVKLNAAETHAYVLDQDTRLPTRPGSLIKINLANAAREHISR